jgi:hypothetical protein
VTYKITAKGSLSLGTKPGVNDGMVGCCTNFLGGPGTAIPIGSSIERDEIHDAVQLFRGSQPGVNDGYVTTVAGFKNGTYVEWGYTIKEEYHSPNSYKLYSVIGGGGGCDSGEVSPNPHHKRCQTVPIGWSYYP